MSDFWQTIAVYCEHLAPVTGPLLSSAGRTAAALHNAECEARTLEPHIQMLRSIPALAAPEDDED